MNDTPKIPANFPVRQDLISGGTTSNPYFTNRRVPRVDVTHSNPPVSLGPFGPVRATFRVKTLAEFGASLATEGSDLRTDVGQTRQVVLSVGTVQLPTLAKIIYADDKAAGLQFINPPLDFRSFIREEFALEFSAGALEPNVRTMNSSRDQFLQHVSYGAGQPNGIDFILNENEILSIEVRISKFDVVLKWYKKGAIQAVLSTQTPIHEQFLRNRIICFARNLKGLHPKVLETLTRLLVSAKIEIEKKSA